VQPVPEAAYRSDFRENTNSCLQRDSNLGPLAQQESVLPLDHCDPQYEYSKNRNDASGYNVHVLQTSRVYAADVCMHWRRNEFESGDGGHVQHIFCLILTVLPGPSHCKNGGMCPPCPAGVGATVCMTKS